MKKKFMKLSGWSFALALIIFLLSYFMFHYVLPDGTITTVFQEEAGKPMVTALWAILGVLFLFTGILSQLIARIFYPEKK